MEKKMESFRSDGIRWYRMESDVNQSATEFCSYSAMYYVLYFSLLYVDITLLVPLQLFKPPSV
jgi:hypothetical protein